MAASLVVEVAQREDWAQTVRFVACVRVNPTEGVRWEIDRQRRPRAAREERSQEGVVFMQTLESFHVLSVMIREVCREYAYVS